MATIASGELGCITDEPTISDAMFSKSMGGGLRDTLNVPQDVPQVPLGIDVCALRVWVVVQRVGATNLIRRVCVEGDEGTGVPMLLFNTAGVRALVEMRGNCHLFSKEICGADQAGEEKFGANFDSSPCVGCNVCMLPVGDELESQAARYFIDQRPLSRDDVACVDWYLEAAF